MATRASDRTIKDIAAMLLEAEASRRPIAPIIEQCPELTPDDAYRIQLAVVEAKLGDGARVVGKKIGLTSKAMQRLLGVTEPDYGHILHTMIVSEGEPIRLGALIQPRIEPEVAFLLREDLAGPGVSTGQVLAATAGVMPALELVDSRIKDWKIKLADTIADNASSARVILGGTLVPIEGLDLRLVGMVFERNGEIVSTGAGAAVWGNPADAVAWLANKIALYGVSLKAGEVVMPGALVAAVDVRPGDYIRATFDRIGAVTARFVE